MFRGTFVLWLLHSHSNFKILQAFMEMVDISLSDVPHWHILNGYRGNEIHTSLNQHKTCLISRYDWMRDKK